MRGVILAAGEGRRLGPLTADIPKPMLPIAGRPILEHNVRLLAQHGVREIAINTHHAGGTIVKHFGDGERFGVTIRYSHEKTLLGTSGALRALRDFLSERFVVLYGDNLTTCDIGALADFHASKNADVSIAVVQRENPAASGIIAAGPDDRITRFLEKPKGGEVFSTWINTGIMICEPEILDDIPQGVSDFGKDVLPALIEKGKRLFAYRMNDRFAWIDSPEDYERTKASW
ncbi:MAG TPA: nucleotidyltransferase family protein [Candidatus Rubrimentiphilum sp.]|nr:nucleotidyltransferase family protein [Candidatus Rubrimentiphilum sp.]